MHIGVGVLAAQLAHRRGDDQARRVADRDAARLGGGPGLRGGSGGRAQQGLGPRQEDLAGFGEPRALRRAIQQPDTQLLLQAPDLSAQRRLRDLQGGGRATEVLVFGHDDEVPDQSQVEVYHRRCRVGHAVSVTIGLAVVIHASQLSSDYA